MSSILGVGAMAKGKRIRAKTDYNQLKSSNETIASLSGVNKLAKRRNSTSPSFQKRDHSITGISKSPQGGKNTPEPLRGLFTVIIVGNLRCRV
jgi:hypothetical protein